LPITKTLILVIISMSSRIALQSFSLNNKIADISPQDEIFRFDAEANKQINREAPWGKEWAHPKSPYYRSFIVVEYSPHYFKTCKISVIALIKMAGRIFSFLCLRLMQSTGDSCPVWSATWNHGSHARKSNGKHSYHYGFFRPSCPGNRDPSKRREWSQWIHGGIYWEEWEGTLSPSTWVIIIFSAHISFQAGRLENAIGWYHSHPGYGCWLSGIDVNTQLNNQKFQDPFVAVVVSPFNIQHLHTKTFHSFFTTDRS